MIEWLNVPGACSSMSRRAGWFRSVRSSSVCVVVTPKSDARNGSTPSAATPAARPPAKPNNAASRWFAPGGEKNPEMPPASGARIADVSTIARFSWLRLETEETSGTGTTVAPAAKMARPRSPVARPVNVAIGTAMSAATFASKRLAAR